MTILTILMFAILLTINLVNCYREYSRYDRLRKTSNNITD
jgi:hypothetical protein